MVAHACCKTYIHTHTSSHKARPVHKRIRDADRELGMQSEIWVCGKESGLWLCTKRIVVALQRVGHVVALQRVGYGCAVTELSLQ